MSSRRNVEKTERRMSVAVALFAPVDEGDLRVIVLFLWEARKVLF